MADITYDASSRCWVLQMETSTYCFGLNEHDSSLQHIYWGPHIASSEILETAHSSEPLLVAFESPTGMSREEYVPWGEMRFSEPGLKVTYADGTRVIEWLFAEHGIERSRASQTLWLRFRDPGYPLTVTLYYRIYDGHDVIERWVRLENSGGSGPITIEQALSADWHLPRRESYRLTYLHGQHIKEMQLAEKAAALGVEVFVVDDGWFGARSNDYAGLGDWTVNLEKFPRGLNLLIARVNALGMRFGLWVEPEMVNPDSELYRAHPDWVYHFRHRSRTVGRNQLVLNLARDDVLAWVLATLDSLLSEQNIEFIKWDMNRFFAEPGWPDEVGRNPERVWLDLGILSRVEQVWPSDNTDALDRLRIQEGFSYAYAPRVMMCWVTDCPNFVTHRTVSLRYRFHVAMAGALGIGGDLSRWTQQELAEARDFIATYKRVRSTIQNGLLYRLRSPRVGSVASSQYVAQDGNEVVVFAWGHSQQFGETRLLLPLHGLEKEARYTDTIDGTVYTGSYLTQKGLTINLLGDFDSRMVHLICTTSASG